MWSVSEQKPLANKGGRRPGRAHAAWEEYGAKYGATWRAVRRVGIARLEACKDDDARQVLLRPVNRSARVTP
jgi:hypothetical protein